MASAANHFPSWLLWSIPSWLSHLLEIWFRQNVVGGLVERQTFQSCRTVTTHGVATRNWEKVATLPIEIVAWVHVHINTGLVINTRLPALARLNITPSLPPTGHLWEGWSRAYVWLVSWHLVLPLRMAFISPCVQLPHIPIAGLWT